MKFSLSVPGSLLWHTVADAPTVSYRGCLRLFPVDAQPSAWICSIKEDRYFQAHFLRGAFHLWAPSRDTFRLNSFLFVYFRRFRDSLRTYLSTLLSTCTSPPRSPAEKTHGYRSAILVATSFLIILLNMAPSLTISISDPIFRFPIRRYSLDFSPFAFS